VPALLVAALSVGACGDDDEASAPGDSNGGASGSTSSGGTPASGASGSPTGGAGGSTAGEGGASIGGSGAAGGLGPAGEAGSDAGAAAGSAGVGNGGAGGNGGAASGCSAPLPDDWIFCEDFESFSPAVYFTFDDDASEQRVVTAESVSGTSSLEVVWQPGEIAAGSLSLSFGRTPVAGGAGHRTSEDFGDIYWRVRMKNQASWPDVGPGRLFTVSALAFADLGQAMVANVWAPDPTFLVVAADLAGCVTGSTVACHGYNDIANLRDLGRLTGTTPVFSDASSGAWRCIEGHVALNTPGQADGAFQFWVDGTLQGARSDLDWRGSWDDFGINRLDLENRWSTTDGPPTELRRWFDDLVVATARVGCM
jgi:hypothetical protein